MVACLEVPYSALALQLHSSVLLATWCRSDRGAFCALVDERALPAEALVFMTLLWGPTWCRCLAYPFSSTLLVVIKHFTLIWDQV